ncbi:hypothetical protein Tco_1225248 [Tanacetum coccineum]
MSLRAGELAAPPGRELYPIRLSHTRLAWALIETKSLPSSSLPPDPDLPFENSVGYPTELDGSTSHPLPRGEYELELDQAHCSPAMRKNAYFESSKDLLNSALEKSVKEVMDIHKRTKMKPKLTKPSTRMDRA